MLNPPAGSDPLGLAAKLRRDADEMLDRVEAAVKRPSGYDFMDTQADVELFRRFWVVWEDRLTHTELVGYQKRVAAIQTWNTTGKKMIF